MSECGIKSVRLELRARNERREEVMSLYLFTFQLLACTPSHHTIRTWYHAG